MSRHSDRVEDLLESILGELEELNANLADESEPDSGESEESDEPAESVESPTCGVNDCGRSVATPEDTCWQHSED